MNHLQIRLNFAGFLSDIFQTGREDDDVSRLIKIPLVVVATHLHSLSSAPSYHSQTTACAEHDVLDSIADSCAIPVFFRTVENIKTHPRVDGGIVDNFPAFELTKDNEDGRFGKILGIGFKPMAGQKFREGSNLTRSGFLLSLLEAAMEHSVKRSSDLLDLHFQIPNPLETLDFENAIKFIDRAEESNPYDDLKKTFLDVWIPTNISALENTDPSSNVDFNTLGSMSSDQKYYRLQNCLLLLSKILKIVSDIKRGLEKVRYSEPLRIYNELPDVSTWETNKREDIARQLIAASAELNSSGLSNLDLEQFESQESGEFVNVLSGTSRTTADNSLKLVVSLAKDYNNLVDLLNSNSGNSLAESLRPTIKSRSENALMNNLFDVFTNVPKTYFDAKTSCEGIIGSLVSIQSECIALVEGNQQ